MTTHTMAAVVDGQDRAVAVLVQRAVDALGDSTRAAQVLRCRIVDGVGDYHENIRQHAAACSHALDKLDELAELIRLDLEDFAR